MGADVNTIALGDFNPHHGVINALSAGTLQPNATAGTGFLDYNTLTHAFTVGQVVTGGTSGAHGVITADNGTTKLTLSGIVGTFLANEPLTDPLGGAAKATRAQYKTLAYSGAVGKLTAGMTILGITSTATATVLGNDDAGTLALNPVSGTFQNAELLLENTIPTRQSAGINGREFQSATVAVILLGGSFSSLSFEILYWSAAAGKFVPNIPAQQFTATTARETMVTIRSRIFYVRATSLAGSAPNLRLDVAGCNVFGRAPR